MTRDILAPLDVLIARADAAISAGEVSRAPREVTAETLTDEMIHDALDALPPGHYSRQWYLDALGSENHPMRRANARREVAAAINARSKGR